jgi:hypothetical protein
MIKTIAAAPGKQVKHIPMSGDEVSQRIIEQDKWQSEKPKREWAFLMAKTDKKMPRQLEDIIDALDEEAKSRIAVKTLEAYNEKKTIRSQKPQGE